MTSDFRFQQCASRKLSTLLRARVKCEKIKSCLQKLSCRQSLTSYIFFEVLKDSLLRKHTVKEKKFWFFFGGFYLQLFTSFGWSEPRHPRKRDTEGRNRCFLWEKKRYGIIRNRTKKKGTLSCSLVFTGPQPRPRRASWPPRISCVDQPRHRLRGQKHHQ